VNCKSIIALGLGCLSIGILLPSFPDTAEAQPVFERSSPALQSKSSRVSGFLVGTDGTYVNIPCAALKVEMVEYNIYVPSKQPSTLDFFANQKVLATGSGIDDRTGGTCKYEVVVSEPLSVARLIKGKSYGVIVRGGNYGGITFHKTSQGGLPEYLNLNVVVAPVTIPR
jgi:hypothetical protein